MVTQEQFAALARQLEDIESRRQITDLIYRYTECVRDRTESKCADLMTEDAWIELHHADALYPGQSEVHERFSGKAEILGSFKSVAGNSAVVWPMIHNLRIELDGDLATSRCVMVSSVRPLGMEFIGEYRDQFRRVDGQWLFASRTFTGYGDMDGKNAHQAYEQFTSVKT